MGACSLVEETNCPAQACPTGTVCLAGACATSCTLDTDCPGGPCIDVTIGGTTIRGCGDARRMDAGVADAGVVDAAGDAGAPPQIVMLAAGERTACALTSAGAVWCWGGNESGQLGDGVSTHDGSCTDPSGTFDDHSVAPVSAAITDALQITLGHAHACVRVLGTSSAGEARCWGENGAGQLGHTGAGAGSPIPVRVVDGVGATITGILQLDLYANSSVARTASGLLGWGDGFDGQLGFDAASGYVDIPQPWTATGLTLTDFDITQAGAGIDTDGAVRTWGRDDHGALGRGTTDGLVHEDFAPVAGVSGALAIDHGYMAACARTATEVSCWGYPWTALGRDGDHSACPDAEGSACARPVMGLPAGEIVDVAISSSTLCIVMMGGDVYCTSPTSDTLVRRTGLVPMASLVAGDEFFCGVTLDRRIFCWGRGTCGQTGDANHPAVGDPNEIVIR